MPINNIQSRNFIAALAVAPDRASAERLAFAIWSESAGYIYANDGTNKSNSPGFDKNPQWPAILRKSLEIPHDRVGSNGRSTGMLQQISKDVGGGWGDMKGTMDPAISAQRFLAALVVTNIGIYRGYNLRSDGTKEFVNVNLTPIAADVLRVQQPLANEAKSSNYSATQVEYAIGLAAQFWGAIPAPVAVKPSPSNSNFLATLLHWS